MRSSSMRRGTARAAPAAAEPHQTITRPGRMIMNVQMLKFAALAALAALASTGGGVAALTGTAFAAEVKAPATIVATVRYDDLNLRTAAGVDRLNARIRAAAERLCIEPG